MPTGVYPQLIAAVSSVIATAGTGQIAGANVTLLQTDIPQLRESIEAASLPAILLCLSDQPEEHKPFGTGPGRGYQSVTYLVQLLVVSAPNRAALKGRDDTLVLRDRLMTLFARPDNVAPFVSAGEVVQAWAVPRAPIARATWLKNYLVSDLSARFRVIQQM